MAVAMVRVPVNKLSHSYCCYPWGYSPWGYSPWGYSPWPLTKEFALQCNGYYYL